MSREKGCENLYDEFFLVILQFEIMRVIKCIKY